MWCTDHMWAQVVIECDLTATWPTIYCAAKANFGACEKSEGRCRWHIDGGATAV